MTPSTVVRDLGIYLDSDVSIAQPCLANCFTLLPYPKAATFHPSLVVSLGLSVSHCCTGVNEARLRECYASRHFVVPAKPSSGGHERSSSSGIAVQSTRSHHSAASSPPLATRAGANCLQASRASVPVPPSRRPTWLTTYSWSLNFLADDAYVHRRPQHWSYHRPGFEPLAIELFPSQQQKRGTVCRRK